MKLLLDKGAKIDPANLHRFEQTPLLLASMKGYTFSFPFPFFSRLAYLTLYSHSGVVEELLAHKADHTKGSKNERGIVCYF